MAATAAESAPQAKGPSLVVQVAVLLAMTVLAAGMGFGAVHMLGIAPGAAPAESSHTAAPKAKKPADDGLPEEPVTHPNSVLLAPLTVSLASPSSTWIRLELSLVFAGTPDPVLADTIHQDLMAFLRTLKLHQIEGPSGFQHLRADLDDRVRIRSEGKVTGVLLRTLLFE